MDLIAKTFKDLLPKLDQGLMELQDAKRGAMMEKDKDKARTSTEQLHPLLRSNQSPGAGRIEEEGSNESSNGYPVLPGVLDWIV